MQVNTLLKKAKKCVTTEDVHNFLLSEFIPLLEGFKKLSNLHVCNPDFDMEEAGAYMNVEFNRVISNHYIIQIKPTIRSGKFEIYISMDRMKDGLGLSSADYETVDDMEAEVNGEDADTVSSLVKKAVAIAINQHARLLEEVGVSPKLALSVAKKSW